MGGRVLSYQERRAAFARGGFAEFLSVPIEELLLALGSRGVPPEPHVIPTCLVRADDVAPHLIALMERAASGESLREAEEMIVARGLYVLAGAREASACPALWRMLALPEEQLDPIMGDITTETLPKIAASVYDDDAEALFAAIADPARNEYVRHSLLRAATFLAWDGRIDLDRMRRFLVQFDEEGLADGDNYVWVGWTEGIAELGFADLTSRVVAGWNRMPERTIDRRHYDDDLRHALARPRDMARMAEQGLGYVDDIQREMAWWDYDRSARSVSPIDDVEPSRRFGSRTPVSNPLRHVGRNDPCPCGSGRKAKKCCLA